MTTKDKYYPNTLKVDDRYTTTRYKNRNINNLQNMKEMDEYVCVFENVGVEYPEMAMGLKYKTARSKNERKEICENDSRRTPGESTLYLKRDDWINPDVDEYECAAFDENGKRLIYDVSFENMKFPSKKLCDAYSNGNGPLNHPRYLKVKSTKMVPKQRDNPIIDLRVDEVDDSYSNTSRGKIFWFIYFILIVLILYWNINYAVERPYSFYDYVNSIFMSKTIFIILLFGAYVFLFCPFNMCTLNENAPLYRKDFTKATKDTVCGYTDNTSSYLENEVLRNYDNSYYMKFFDPLISLIFIGNRNVKNQMKEFNDYACEYCKMEYNCIDRPPFNIIDIIKPLIIEVDINSLNINNENYEFQINEKYKLNSSNKPYDTGSIIILKTGNKNDDVNNSVFMCCCIINENSSNKNSLNDINGLDYEYKWVKIKTRKGDFKYNDDVNLLRIKRCPVSYRVFAIDTNYDMIGYNISLSVSEFINKFSNNFGLYYEYPYFPNFSISELNNDPQFNKKPDFIKRKLTKIYKYLINNPSYKFRTKNVSFYNGNLVRYDYILSPRQNITDTYTLDIIFNCKLYLEECKKYRNLISEINDFYNDDENDEDYLKHYNGSHMELNKDVYLTSDYNYDFKQVLANINLDNIDNINDIMYKFNIYMVNLNYVQREELRTTFSKEILKRYNELKTKNMERKNPEILSNIEFLKYKANVQLSNDSNSKLITYKFKNVQSNFYEIFVFQEFVSEHIYEKNYTSSYVENSCSICGQKCNLD